MMGKELRIRRIMCYTGTSTARLLSAQLLDKFHDLIGWGGGGGGGGG